MSPRKCYYEIMELERTATEDEIRSAYRRLARIWHPDKNLHQTEVAEEAFKAIRSAYEVLSDPNERAWYDAHREDILAGGDGTNQQRDDGENLWQYFSSSCFSGYTDSDDGFFKVFSEAFDSIDKDETKFEPSRSPAPKFGTSTSNYTEQVRTFYNYWINFSSGRSFAWKDVYNTTQAPNRDVRRVMEKENKRERDKARRGFNELVRRLAEFARKKDPRVMNWAKEQATQKAERDEQAKVNKARQAQEMRTLQQAARDAQQAQLDSIDLSGMDPSLLMSEKDLKKHKHLLSGSASPSPGNDEASEEEEIVEEFYCPACKKLFKSDKQFKNHENSKKHKELAAKLRKELMEEEEALNATAASAKGAQSIQTEGNGDATDIAGLEDEEDRYIHNLEALRDNDDLVHTTYDSGLEDSISAEDDAILHTIENLDQYKIHDHHTSAESRTTQADQDAVSDKEEDDDDEILNMMANSKSRFAFEEDSDEDDVEAVSHTGKKTFNFSEFESSLASTSATLSSTKSSQSSSTASPTLSEVAQDAPDKKKKRRRAAKEKPSPTASTSTTSTQSNPTTEQRGKNIDTGKKGNKKKQDEEASGPTCRTCGSTFPSKTALHAHLKQTKHAIV